MTVGNNHLQTATPANFWKGSTRLVKSQISFKIMAKSTKPVISAETPKAAAPKAPTVLVAGHGATKDGDVFVMFKDKVHSNPLFKAIGDQRATMTGTRFLAKGITLEQAQEALPRGSKVEGAAWGPERESKFGGVFYVLFEGETVPEEVEAE
jgi:hypothetical protein